MLALSFSGFDPFRKSRSLDRNAALMHPLCSINTRMAAMNSGVVRLSMIAAMVMLATFGTTRAEEAAKLSVTVPVLSNTGPDAAAYGADEGFPLGTLATASQMRHLVATYSHFDERHLRASFHVPPHPGRFSEPPSPRSPTPSAASAVK